MQRTWIVNLERRRKKTMKITVSMDSLSLAFNWQLQLNVIILRNKILFQSNTFTLRALCTFHSVKSLISFEKAGEKIKIQKMMKKLKKKEKRSSAQTEHSKQKQLKVNNCVSLLLKLSTSLDRVEQKINSSEYLDNRFKMQAFIGERRKKSWRKLLIPIEFLIIFLFSIVYFTIHLKLKTIKKEKKELQS